VPIGVGERVADQITLDLLPIPRFDDGAPEAVLG
jgi:hypothetical protein